MSEKKAKYPGEPSVSDGAGAIVYVETAVTEAATAYPITPTTTMGSGYQEYVANGAKNLWGTPLDFSELESDHSAASTCEGYAIAGGRVTNFTSGQGLILMKEVLYTISGKRLPVVFNIGARALTSHSLNVHCGHDDIMGVNDVGWGCVFARNNQEAADLCLISRRTAEDTETPFFNTQDGFLTTHTVENILLPEPELMKDYIGDPRERIRRLFSTETGMMVGVVQNQDSYMKGKVAQRFFYDKVKSALVKNMKLYSELTGRNYDLIDGYRMEDAEYAIVGLGSSMLTARPAVDFCREKLGLKVGVVNICAYRPFPGEEIVEMLKGVKAFSVIERLDIPLAGSNPLTLEVKAAFSDALLENGVKTPQILSGVYGLGSRDFKVEDCIAVFQNMAADKPQKFFVTGVMHDLALKPYEQIDVRGKGSFSMRGHSVGGYGSVTTNKVIATFSGNVFGLNVQAYPKYGSEKKGLPTTFYLSLSEDPILTHCELDHLDFVPIQDVNAFLHSNPLKGLVEGGMAFLQSQETDPAKVWAAIPKRFKKMFKEQKLRLLYMDMVKVAGELAPTADLAMRMQGIVLTGVFLKMTPYKEKLGWSDDEFFNRVRVTLDKYFGKRGEAVVNANLEAVKRGFNEVLEVPRDVMEAELAAK